MSQAYFDQIAGEWDALRASMFGEEVRSAALERAALHHDAVALDLGAGTGFIAEGLAPLVRQVHVVDNSPEMLSVARQNLAAFQNIEFHLADGSEIPLPEGSIDVALANMYLHHMPDPQAAILEIARVLRPGGRLVLTDLDEHTYEWLRTEQHDLWLGLPRDRVKGWLEEAGLVNVIVEGTGQSCCSGSQCCEETAAVSVFVAVGTRPRPEMQSAVQEHYRQVATGGSGCCTPSLASDPVIPGDLSARSAVPLDVIQPESASCCEPALVQETDAELSLGCGNPVGLAGLRPGEIVLDIGSGAGADVFPAAQKVGEHGRVIGLDMLEEMLSRARATAAKHGYENVEFRQGDAQAIPLEDAGVDIVMSNCVINLVQDKAQAFREAFRVLKPGGRLSISDIVTDSPFSPAMHADPQAWSACISGALPEREYLALISQAGFVDLELSRSQAWPTEDGTRVYSLSIQARKPE